MTHHTLLRTVGAAALLSLSAGMAAQAQTIITTSNGIIRNSLCVGVDCQSGIPFSDSTIIVKENNTRIKFADTSTAASFPRNDWELEANSQTNGGDNRFTLWDCGEDSNDGGCGAPENVLSVEAGAGNNAVYVDDGGRVGFGTGTPVVELHVRDGDTPTLRLEQDNSNGFDPQTWDVAGNEANFFIRDVTNGSALPFRSRPGAPTSSIDIATDGDVGMGTASPGGALHVSRTAGAAAIMLRLSNNNRPVIDLDNTSVAAGEGLWKVSSANNGDFEINNDAISGAIPVEFDLDKNGNLTLAGTVTAPSSRHFKADLDVVDSMEVLAKLDAMPIVTWHYKNQSADNRHMGPVAEDFYEAFGLGESEEFIALNDLSGVALAAIKALSQENDELHRRLETLESRLADN